MKYVVLALVSFSTLPSAHAGIVYFSHNSAEASKKVYFTSNPA